MSTLAFPNSRMVNVARGLTTWADLTTLPMITSPGPYWLTAVSSWIERSVDPSTSASGIAERWVRLRLISDLLVLGNSKEMLLGSGSSALRISSLWQHHVEMLQAEYGCSPQTRPPSQRIHIPGSFISQKSICDRILLGSIQATNGVRSGATRR